MARKKDRAEVPTGPAALFIPIEAKPLRKAFDHFNSGKNELYFVCDAQIGEAAKIRPRHVYFKIKGEKCVSACAVFIGLTTENPKEKRLPESRDSTGKFYYGLKDLKPMPSPVALTDLRYYTTGRPLRNSVPGGCLIRDWARD